MWGECEEGVMCDGYIDKYYFNLDKKKIKVILCVVLYKVRNVCGGRVFFFVLINFLCFFCYSIEFLFVSKKNVKI